jgi:hypothetical protein
VRGEDATKKYPHRPYADGGMVKKGPEKSELPYSFHPEEYIENRLCVYR